MKRVVTLIRKALIGIGEEAHTTGFAARLACGGTKPMPALAVARAHGVARYDILCRAGG